MQRVSDDPAAERAEDAHAEPAARDAIGQHARTERNSRADPVIGVVLRDVAHKRGAAGSDGDEAGTDEVGGSRHRYSRPRRPFAFLSTNLTDTQAATLRRIKAAGGEVWRAYTLKEAVRGIFAPGLTPADVEILIDRLQSRLARSRLQPFLRLGKTIRKHREGILAAPAARRLTSRSRRGTGEEDP